MPEPDALAKLLDADRCLADKGVPRAFVISSAWTEDGKPRGVPNVDSRRTANDYEKWPWFIEQKMVAVTRATFVSIFLPRSIIAQYGLPQAP